MIAIIDNYDSFTYNLVQYVGVIDTNLEVFRNDEITIKSLESKQISHIIISPGPGWPDDAGKTIDIIKACSCKVGIAINPDTSLSVLDDIINEIDLILLMSVYPGFGGQKFIKEVLKKIEKISEIKNKNGFKFDIEVDGGINFSNFKEVLEAGANILVSGTTIFKENNGDIKKNINFLKTI